MIRSPLPFILKQKKVPKAHNEQRERKRRQSRMTLVAALSGHQGTIFFADTDEIIGSYSKKTIDKMQVWDFPDRPFRFAIAGATTDGTYADALQSELSGALFRVDAFDLRKITEALSDTLAAFYAKHIWPRVGGDKPQMEYLITIQPPDGYTEVFHIAETAVNIMGVTTHWKSIGVVTPMIFTAVSAI